MLHHSKREPSYETLFLSLFFKRKVRHKETKQFAQACAVELSWDFMIFDCKLRLLKSISVTYNQTFTQDNLIFANYRGRKSARVCIKHVALKTTGSLWPCACSELDMKVPKNPVSGTRTGNVTPDPLGSQDRFTEAPVVTGPGVKQKPDLTFQCSLENFCFLSTNHLPKQWEGIAVHSLC